MRAHSRWGIVAASWMVAAVLAGCDVEPPPEFVVNSTVDGSDAAPGDGICEMTAGTADCSLRAALQEADTIDRAHIEVPAGTYELPGPAGIASTIMTISSSIRVSGAGADATVIHGRGGWLRVDGTLVVEDVQTEEVTFVVDGALGVNRTRAFTSSGGHPVVTVAAGGRALFANATVLNRLAHATVSSSGQVGGLYSTFVGVANNYVLETRNAGTTDLQGTVVTDYAQDGSVPGTMWLCFGPVTSSGYNLAPNGTCGLSSEGDIEGGDVVFANDSIDFGAIVPAPASDAVDAVPHGAARCGVGISLDETRSIRPVDADGDLQAACDIGAVELPSG